MNKKLHCMIDLETLGTAPDAAIMQIGAVAFEPWIGGEIQREHGFNRFLKMDESNGTFDHGTLIFWLQENYACGMGNQLRSSSVPVTQALTELIQWPTRMAMSGWWDFECVWANSPDFDLAILRSAYRRHLGHSEPPWHYRASRCCRTLWALQGGRPEEAMEGLTEHDALDDAVQQAYQTQLALQFGLRG